MVVEDNTRVGHWPGEKPVWPAHCSLSLISVYGCNFCFAKGICICPCKFYILIYIHSHIYIYIYTHILMYVHVWKISESGLFKGNFQLFFFSEVVLYDFLHIRQGWPLEVLATASSLLTWAASLQSSLPRQKFSNNRWPLPAIWAQQS